MNLYPCSQKTDLLYHKGCYKSREKRKNLGWLGRSIRIAIPYQPSPSGGLTLHDASPKPLSKKPNQGTMPNVHLMYRPGRTDRGSACREYDIVFQLVLDSVTASPTLTYYNIALWVCQEKNQVFCEKPEKLPSASSCPLGRLAVIVFLCFRVQRLSEMKNCLKNLPCCAYIIAYPSPFVKHKIINFKSLPTQHLRSRGARSARFCQVLLPHFFFGFFGNLEKSILTILAHS